MKKHVVRIGPNGEIQFIDKPELAGLKSEGAATKRRASHVEPCSRPLRWLFHLLRGVFGEAGAVAAFTRAWPVYWRINLTPSGGPVIDYRYLDRSLAIADEVAWLTAHRLGAPPPR